MYYLQIGENGEFQKIHDREEAAKLYARHKKFKMITTIPLGDNRWEVKTVDWRGNARFTFCCYGKTKFDAIGDFYRKVVQKMEDDRETQLLTEDEFHNALLFA